MKALCLQVSLLFTMSISIFSLLLFILSEFILSETFIGVEEPGWPCYLCTTAFTETDLIRSEPPGPGGGRGNFNRRVTGMCHLTSEIAP